jgi:hypothetical protein
VERGADQNNKSYPRKPSAQRARSGDPAMAFRTAHEISPCDFYRSAPGSARVDILITRVTKISEIRNTTSPATQGQISNSW